MGLPREVSRVREILAAARLEHVRYAIRDIAVLAEQLAREGKEILPLNIGDPLKFDFRTPPHLVEAVAKAMRDGKNGYAPSPGIGEALEAIRAEADRKGIRNIQSVFVTQGVSEAFGSFPTHAPAGPRAPAAPHTALGDWRSGARAVICGFPRRTASKLERRR